MSNVSFGGSGGRKRTWLGPSAFCNYMWRVWFGLGALGSGMEDGVHCWLLLWENGGSKAQRALTSLVLVACPVDDLLTLVVN
jgi:hypothetical protein